MSRPKRRTYRTTNWHDDTASLTRRGSLAKWFHSEIQWLSTPTGKRGRQQVFIDAAIQTCPTLKALFGLPLRQTTGMVASLLDLAQSNITGAFEGDNRRLGLTLGGYAVHEVRENFFADGFLTLGAGRNNLDMAKDVLDLESDYTSRTLTFGAALSGVVDQGRYQFLPELAFSYGRTWIGDVGFTGRAYGLEDDTLSLNAGSVSLADITFRPEFRLSLDGLPVVDSLSVFSFAPRLVCQEVRTDIVTQGCGGGAEIGLFGKSEDGLTTYDARIIRDRIANRTGTTFQLGFERRF